MKQIATVNAKALAAATLFQARLDVRYYLNGVLITPHPECGVNIVATDGHRMVVVTDSTGTCQQDMILKVEPASVSKMKQAAMKEVEVLKENNEVFCKVTGQTKGGVLTKHISYAEIIDGRFPDWKAVIKDKLPDQPARFAQVNSTYLKDFCEASKIISEKRINGVSVMNGMTKDDPVSVIFSDAANVNLHMRGIIMPLRISDQEELHWLPKGNKS